MVIFAWIKSVDWETPIKFTKSEIMPAAGASILTSDVAKLAVARQNMRLPVGDEA